ncbi:glutathione peroxidase [Thermophagus sp. OGC60D27]|uniref:glutathione peroxidase n=1 Tax=Thermophagus sp. OGC60D27 TaxID=3458415 RepID=UPI00403805E9
MKIKLFFTTILLLAGLSFVVGQNDFYNFKVKTIDGETFDFSRLKGKKVMIVNTASKCGFTPQYQQLQEIYQKYGGNGFIILGFPANNFLNQEPGTPEEIRNFCQVNYGVTFPIMEKISVKGDDQHPLYQWLTNKELNGVLSSKVKWNFQKYLISADGKLEKVIPPKTKPDDPEIIQWIKN